MKMKRRKYDSEYKEMIISLVKEGQNCAQVGREYVLSNIPRNIAGNRWQANT